MSGPINEKRNYWSEKFLSFSTNLFEWLPDDYGYLFFAALVLFFVVVLIRIFVEIWSNPPSHLTR